MLKPTDVLCANCFFVLDYVSGISHMSSSFIYAANILSACIE